MPYLNIDLDFPEHRKTKRLVSILGRGSEAMLLRLWCYTARHHPEDGRLSEYSPEEIESLAGWVGKPGRMLDTMQLVGWMDRDKQGWFIKNWLEHQGHIAAYRAKGKAMADARWKKVRECLQHAGCIADSNARAEPIELRVQADKQTSARPTLKQVKDKCQFIGCPESEGEQFWNHFEASGWIDKNGHKIQSWEAKLATWAANARAKPIEKAHHTNGANTVVLGKELDRIIDRMRTIKGTYGDHQSWSQDDVTEFNTLRIRRTELRKTLGVQA